MLSSYASRFSVIIYSQWLTLPQSQTYFHGPKDVLAIEVPSLQAKGAKSTSFPYTCTHMEMKWT